MSEVYLVTGASGFVGSRLVERLLSMGHRVAAVGRRLSWAEQAAARSDQKLMVFRGDLGDAAFVESIWEQAGPFDGVFHYAAQIPADIKGLSRDYDLAQYVQCNVLGTAAILDAASRQNKTRLVYASSISLFGKVERLPIPEDHPACPADPYGLSKFQGEELVRLAASAGAVYAVSLRFPGMIGIGNDYGAVHLYTTLCLSSQPINVYGNGKPRKDYIAVEDVVEASVLAMAQAGRFQFEVFNVGGCEPGVPPPPLAEIARWVAQAYGEGQVITNDRKPAEPVDMYFDNLKPNRLLGYSPRPLCDRIQEYVLERKTSALGS